MRARPRALFLLAIVVLVIAVGAIITWKFVFAPPRSAGAPPVFDSQTHRAVSSSLAGGQFAHFDPWISQLGGESQAAVKLLDYLRCSSSLVGSKERNEAARMLGACGPDALPPLLCLQKDIRPDNRFAALWGLYLFHVRSCTTNPDGKADGHGKQVMAAIDRATKDADPAISNAARKMLAPKGLPPGFLGPPKDDTGPEPDR